METIRFSLIGQEDINWGSGTFEAELPDGSIVTLSKVSPVLVSPGGVVWRLTITDAGLLGATTD